MSTAQELDSFIKSLGRDVFIEAEAKPSRLRKFYLEYNSKYTPFINNDTVGVIVLDENVNKWGLELRLYMHGKPSFMQVTKNTVYRGEYLYRVNDVNVIREMFDLGYRIGLNY